ncbi:gas vesicle protein GvpO [Sutcliffiella rhizosphaerae]|nr:gas vesicle protein GvpO [Sutcliffiella rhizosphaerae]
MKKVLKEVTEFFTEFVKPPYKITAVQPTEQGWEVEVEVIEEKEYMKAYAKDQMIGVYHAKLNKEMEVESFNRRDLRSRSSVELNNE